MRRLIVAVPMVFAVACAPIATATAPPPIQSGPVTTAPAPALTPSATPDSTTAVVPSELVGKWSSSGPTTEIAFNFLPDGRFRSAELVSQPGPRGLFEFSLIQDGRVEVDGDRLRIRPTTSVKSRTDPMDPAGDYTNQPAETQERLYRWRVTGSRLALTDPDELEIVLVRQP
jgi:hypothetical protein